MRIFTIVYFQPTKTANSPVLRYAAVQFLIRSLPLGLAMLRFSSAFLLFVSYTVSTTGVAAEPQAHTNTSSQVRPNILWITSEDNGHHWLGCYGNALAQTPNIDELARTGVRYQSAYANAPVCAVARNTLITGRYACSLGTHNMRSRYPIPQRFKPYVSYLRDAGYYCVNRSKTDYNYRTDDKSHWDQCSGKAHWKNRSSGQPFFAVFNTTLSHESCLFAAKTADFRQRGIIPAKPRVSTQAAQIPPHLPDTPEIRKDWATYHDVISAMDRKVGEWLQELDTAGLRENTIVIYCSDHGGILPRAKRYLYDTGTHIPLVINLPKKWSHLAVESPGTASSRPVSFIDFPPTLLSIAGVTPPDSMQGRVFLGDAAESPEPYVFLFAQRFDARMTRFVRGVTDGRFRYIRNFYPHRHRGIFQGFPYGQIGWRSYLAAQHDGTTTPAQAAIFQQPQPVEELFDTRADPWEIKNLAEDPQYVDRLRKMREATKRKMIEIRDAGIVPEAMYGGLSKRSTVHDYLHSADFPYQSLLDLAMQVGEAKLTDSQILQGLQSNHPVTRYWSATACTVQPPASTTHRPPIKQQLVHLLDDSTQAVRIAAAEALVTMGDTERGLSRFIDLLREEKDEMVVLEALNVTEALQLTQRIPAAVYDRACKTGKYPARMAGDR